MRKDTTITLIKLNNTMKFINRLTWHYDAITNGGATILDCIKVEYYIITTGKYYID